MLSKNKFLLLLLLLSWQTIASAANLLEVYQQALHSDPIFQEAINQRFATKEGVPISLGALLPQINLTLTPAITQTIVTGQNAQPISPQINMVNSPRNNILHSYELNLSVTQTIFNVAQFATLAQQVALSKYADATLNSALQDLMVRVANAYFAVLRDEDNLRFNEINKLAFAQQLDQAKQQYHVGLKTLTDVYTAEASYDSAVAGYIAAKTTLANDKENLRVITGCLYDNLAPLSEDFPLIKPQPMNVDAWVTRALSQNWAIKAAQYNAEGQRQVIKKQFSGHLPTIQAGAQWTKLYNLDDDHRENINEITSSGDKSTRQFLLNINVPIFAGGTVVAETNQAIYNYKVACEQAELATRDTLNITRQSYLNIVSGISKISADQQAIKSTISSLEGLREGYRVGTQTMVDVVNQQQKVLEAQTQYATDRYAFVNNIILLKRAAGTLCFHDLIAINVWLTHDKESQTKQLEERIIPSNNSHSTTMKEHHHEQ